MNEQLDAKLAELNAAVKDAVEARTKWMDEHMRDYAKYPIGTDLYARFPERCALTDYIGKVTEYYRYHGGGRDWRYDTSMSICYRTDRGDNSSRFSGMVESAGERAMRLRSEAEYLSRPPRPLSELTWLPSSAADV